MDQQISDENKNKKIKFVQFWRDEVENDSIFLLQIASFAVRNFPLLYK